VLPNTILIGAQKSGSTFLANWLNHHPQVYFKARENKSFEDPEYDSFHISQLERDIEVKVYGFKRVDYLADEKIPERVKLHLPDVKLILVLRNPVMRAISAYYHYMKYGIISVKSLSSFENILKNKINSAQTYNRILSYGLYSKHLKRFFKYFEIRQFLIFKMEDVISGDTNSFWKKVSDFYEINQIAIDRPNIKPEASIYNLNRLRLRSIRNPFVYTYDAYRSNPRSNRSTIGKLVDIGVKRIDRLLLERILTDNKSVPDTLISFLKDFYSEDIETLEKLINIDLSDWKV